MILPSNLVEEEDLKTIITITTIVTKDHLSLIIKIINLDKIEDKIEDKTEEVKEISTESKLMFIDFIL